MRTRYKDLLKTPLKIYLWIALIFTTTGLTIDLIEYVKKDQLFLIWVNSITLIITSFCMFFFAIHKNIRPTSVLFILTIVLCTSCSYVYLNFQNDPLWEHYFLRDTMVFLILLPFTGFLLPRIYVYTLDFIYCVNVGIMWYMSDNSFVKDNAVYLVIMMTGYAFGIELFSRKLKKAFRENEDLNRIIVEKDKEILEKENLRIADQMHQLKESVEIKNKELVSRAMLMAEHMENNSKSAKNLEELSTFIQQDKKRHLNRVIRNIQSEDKSHWKEFQVRFNDIHKDFYTKIKNDYPNLTSGELKLAAFLKLNLTTKEIAILTNTTEGSIEVSRSRLRKKLGMQKTETFTTFLDRY